MNLISKLAGRNPNTILGKVLEKNKSHIGPLSFIIYFLPFIILIIVHDINFGGEVAVPAIYSILFIWYFISLGIIGSIRKNNSLKSEIIEMVVCLPIYISFILSFLILKVFINKKKYPNVTEDKLPLHQRKIKLKRIVRKTKRKKLWQM